MKKDQGKVWLARKLGNIENAAVSWNPFGTLTISWTNKDRRDTFGMITPKLARLLAKRIIEALED